jgi:hypothetical protein
MENAMATKPSSTTAEIIKPHQWTNGGDEVLILRFSAKDGTSSASRLRDGNSVPEQPFQHPTKVGESVTVDDWNAESICGGGIHGWPWGFGLGEGKDCVWDSLWQVYGVKPADVVGELENGQKCKFRSGVLRFVGEWHSAMMFVLNGQIAWVHQASRGASSATGLASAAVATGLYSRARGGEFGCIALAWWNEKEKRSEMRCALTGQGEGSLKPNVRYELDVKGHFVEVS